MTGHTGGSSTSAPESSRQQHGRVREETPTSRQDSKQASPISAAGRQQRSIDVPDVQIGSTGGDDRLSKSTSQCKPSVKSSTRQSRGLQPDVGSPTGKSLPGPGVDMKPSAGPAGRSPQHTGLLKGPPLSESGVATGSPVRSSQTHSRKDRPTCAPPQPQAATAAPAGPSRQPEAAAAAGPSGASSSNPPTRPSPPTQPNPRHPPPRPEAAARSSRDASEPAERKIRLGIETSFWITALREQHQSVDRRRFVEILADNYNRQRSDIHPRMRRTLLEGSNHGGAYDETYRYDYLEWYFADQDVFYEQRNNFCKSNLVLRM